MTAAKAPIRLDLRGLKCPLPALRTRKALAAAQAGDVIEVRCTDPMAAIDIPNLVHQAGHRLLQTRTDAAETVFVIESVAARS